MQDNEIDWLRNIPVYHNLNEIIKAMDEATDTWEYECSSPGSLLEDADKVLAGLVYYLTYHYVSPLFQETVYRILDKYCGKPKEK